MHPVFTKVKSHATEENVRRGRVAPIDKLGNDGADELACTGADAHQAPAEVVDAAYRRRCAAVGVHSMMIDILAIRRLRESALRGREAAAQDEASVPEHEFAEIDAGPAVDGEDDIAEVLDQQREDEIASQMVMLCGLLRTYNSQNAPGGIG